MGTMVGSGRKRRFGKTQYYHWGNSDSMEEADEWKEDIDEALGVPLKVTDDRYGGADIWAKVRDQEILNLYEKRRKSKKYF